MMGWLMNDAGHGTVDMCGENVSTMDPVVNEKSGSRLLKSGNMNNFSKLLKMELGQQIPVKSCYKLKRDMVKRAQSCLSDVPTHMDYTCWYSQKMGQIPMYNCCGLMEYSPHL